MKRIELLAPAGNMDSLVAAVQAGADAIYLGGTFFGARAFANNFNDDELIEAIKYCHVYGVKVYVTCNILIFEHEIDKFISYVDFLYQNNVDAILIQDLGMLDLVHQKFPNLELHASTQMHIHNLDGVKMCEKLGLKRVVLARETSINDIKEIINNCKAEIEVFAHGSLCVSYSGQCLFSSLIGNRSGNRGSCVGSCRLPYKIVDENNNKLNSGDYPLSMKDLNTLEYVGDLIDAGISSIKIEGRMKSPEYVYTVTKLYRMAIDSYYDNKEVNIDEKELLNLKKIFSRGYTKGYLFNEDIKNIINSDRPNHLGIYIGKVIDYKKNFIKIRLTDDVSINDGLRIILENDDYGLILNEFYKDGKLVKEAKNGDIISLKVNKEIPVNSKVLLTKDNSLINEIQTIINNNPRKVKINLNIKAIVNEKLELIVNDGKNEVKVFGNSVSKALKNPTSNEEIENKMQRLGDTVYEINHLNIVKSNDAFIPFKELNELRRKACLELNELRIGKKDILYGEYKRIVPNFTKENLKSVLVNKIDEDLDYDIIYSEEENDNTITKLSKVMHDYDSLDINKEYLVSELGAFNKLKNIYCDYSFNVTNSYTVALLHSLGAKRITLSLELNPKKIENIVIEYQKRYQSNPNLEVIVSGYREVMTLKTNLNDVYEKEKLYLIDRFNNKYLIRKKDNLSYIYEPKKFNDNFNYFDIGVNVIRDNKEI